MPRNIRKHFRLHHRPELVWIFSCEYSQRPSALRIIPLNEIGAECPYTSYCPHRKTITKCANNNWWKEKLKYQIIYKKEQNFKRKLSAIQRSISPCFVGWNQVECPRPQLVLVEGETSGFCGDTELLAPQSTADVSWSPPFDCVFATTFQENQRKKEISNFFLCFQFLRQGLM